MRAALPGDRTATGQISPRRLLREEGQISSETGSLPGSPVVRRGPVARLGPGMD